MLPVYFTLTPLTGGMVELQRLFALNVTYRALLVQPVNPQNIALSLLMIGEMVLVLLAIVFALIEPDDDSVND